MEKAMPLWFWLNIPACVVVFSAVVGIPLWMVFKHPEMDGDHPRSAATAQPRPQAQPQPQPRAAHSPRDRELELTH
jgi:hypothetical protein